METYNIYIKLPKTYIQKINWKKKNNQHNEPIYQTIYVHSGTWKLHEDEDDQWTKL